MLMRTDPFRELDRLNQQVLGTAARRPRCPAPGGTAQPLHLPGPARHDPDSIDLTVEQRVLPSGRAVPVQPTGRDAGRRTALRHLHPPGLPRRDPRRREHRRRLRSRGAVVAGHSG